MLTLNKDAMRIPIGGHQYPSHGIMFRGDTFDEVVERVTVFRINNGISLGDPEQEVLLHYSQNWPFMVKSVPDTPRDSDGHFSAWRSWLQKIWSDPPRGVLTPKEASDRWRVCADCPFNTRYSWIDGRESDELKKRAFLLRRGVDVPKNLQFCALHKADLSVMVFLENPEKFSDKKKDETGYDGCWVKFK